MHDRSHPAAARRRRMLAATGCATAFLFASCSASSTPATSSARSVGAAAAVSSSPPPAGAMVSSSGAASAPAISAGKSTTAVNARNAAAAALLPDRIRSSGMLGDGINIPNPPMEYQQGADLTGFDVELARAMAARLGLKVSFTPLQFAALLTSLDSGRVDIVFSGLFDTVKRQAKYDMIDYFNTGAAIFTTTANAAKYPTLVSLCGQTVETAVGTAFAAQLAALSAKTCVGKPPMAVVEVGGSLAEEVLEVQTGRAAAAITTPENLGYAMSTSPGAYAAVGKPFNPIPYGIQIPKANTGLRDALVMALKDVMADGTYAALLKKYNLQSGARTSVTVNAGT